MSRQTFWQRFVAVVGVALLVGVMGGTSHDVLAHPEGFVFTPLVFLGDPTPGGEKFLDTFDSNIINNRGDVLFTSNVIAGEADAIFLRSKGDIAQIAHVGEDAPGGGVFGPGSMAPTTLNDKGDAGFVYLLDPVSFPLGVNAGVYRFSHTTQTVAPVMRPGVTTAPGGELFAGAHFGASLNDRGDLVFAGMVPTAEGLPFPEHLGLGVGVFKANKKGHISSVVSPGDPVPGGGVFDGAFGPWINDGGDVAFMGHVAGEECLAEGFPPPPAFLIACLNSIYVKKAATGKIRSIAYAGDPAPGGDGEDVYRQAISPVMNNRGDIVFLGDLTPPPAARRVTGVYLHSAGETIRVAGPGDEMPGGGAFVTASYIMGWQIHVNNAGEGVFNAALATYDNENETPDTRLFE